MLRPLFSSLLAIALALSSAAALAADATAPEVVNPVGQWDGYEMIIQADVPLRGTLRQVFIDRASAAEARRSGELPYGTKIVMRDYIGVSDGKGGWKTENNRLVPGQPTVVLVQQKERGWGTTHPPEVRIGEWEFGLYTPAGQPIKADFEKACMPCHKQVEATDYNFLVTNYFGDIAGK
jgi:hypothetical protein